MQKRSLNDSKASLLVSNMPWPWNSNLDQIPGRRGLLPSKGTVSKPHFLMISFDCPSCREVISQYYHKSTSMIQICIDYREATMLVETINTSHPPKQFPKISNFKYQAASIFSHLNVSPNSHLKNWRCGEPHYDDRNEDPREDSQRNL